MNESFPQAAQNPDLQKKYCSDSALGSNLWMNSLIIQEYSFQADSHENSEDLVKKNLPITTGDCQAGCRTKAKP